MDIKKCDRCGACFQPGKYLVINEKECTSISRTLYGNDYDLCEKCTEEFYDFMNKYKKR